jgi:hypothetical protein
LAGTIVLTTGELLVDKDLTIVGPGAAVITVSGNNASRVFEVAPGVAALISGLAVADGQAATGAGVLNDGALTLLDATVTGNTSRLFGFGGNGGGRLQRRGADRGGLHRQRQHRRRQCEQ